MGDPVEIIKASEKQTYTVEIQMSTDAEHKYLTSAREAISINLENLYLRNVVENVKIKNILFYSDKGNRSCDAVIDSFELGQSGNKAFPDKTPVKLFSYNAKNLANTNRNDLIADGTALLEGQIQLIDTVANYKRPYKIYMVFEFGGTIPVEEEGGGE